MGESEHYLGHESHTKESKEHKEPKNTRWWRAAGQHWWSIEFEDGRIFTKESNMWSRMEDIIRDILMQGMHEIKANSLKASIQLNESTNVDTCKHLLVFVRYIQGRKTFLKEFLLSDVTKAIDIHKHQICMKVIVSIFTGRCSSNVR